MSPPQPSSGPKCVLMTTDTVGGVWTYSLDLCRGLQRYGIDVTLVSMGRMPDDAQHRDVSALANVALVPMEFRLEWMEDCENDIARAGDFLLQLERTLRPDVIHLNGYYHAALPFRAPVLVVAHSCVVSWWEACRATPLPHEWDPYRQRVRAAVETAEMLVAPSAAFLECFERLHGKARRSRVVWNGRSGELFRSGPKHNFIFASGRPWDEAKNIGLLCEAAGGLNIPAAIAGDIAGPGGGKAALGQVEVLGRLAPEQLANWLASAPVFVAPARYEPFGLSILEAALSSCALVLGDIASLRELWDGAALFVDPSDAGALRELLRGLSSDPARVADLASRARARAETFSVARMADAYWEIYATLAQSELEAVA